MKRNEIHFPNSACAHCTNTHLIGQFPNLQSQLPHVVAIYSISVPLSHFALLADIVTQEYHLI